MPGVWYWHLPALYDERHGAACRRASIWHLVDLKRAGHTAARTELNIPPDAPTCRRFDSRFEAGTLTGSPGAMCAEVAG